MKQLRRVSRKEIKRAFVIPQLMRASKERKWYLRVASRTEFKHKLRAAKRKGLALSERQLNVIISREYPRRLRTYDASD